MDEREELEQDHIEDLDLAQDLEVPPEHLDGVIGGVTVNKAKTADKAYQAMDGYVKQ